MSDQTRPLIPTGIMTEFGQLMDDPATLLDSSGMDGDVTYVPGISDLRRAHDLAKAAGETPIPLPVNVRWVRRTKANGEPTNERAVKVGRDNYRPVQWDEIGTKDWIKGQPAGATKLPDGGIGLLDMQLMVQDQRSAAKSAIRKQMKWTELNTASKDEALRAAGARVRGSNPEVETELGGPQK
jgi:hypothetical protein